MSLSDEFIKHLAREQCRIVLRDMFDNITAIRTVVELIDEDQVDVGMNAANLRAAVLNFVDGMEQIFIGVADDLNVMDSPQARSVKMSLQEIRDAVQYES